MGRKTILGLAVLAFFTAAFFNLQPFSVSAQFDEAGFTGDSLTSPQAQQTAATRAAQQRSNQEVVACSWLSNWDICLTDVFYGLFVGLGSILAYVGAYFFSIAVQISLTSAAYSLEFLSQGWTIMRDLANMTFLFILVYIALTIIFRAETESTVKMLAAVVVVALLVNFSFFFTRVVIDAGNILAVQFYNSIQVSGPGIGNGSTKDLAAGIMGAVRIHELFSTASFQQYVNQTDSSTLTNRMARFIVLSFLYISVGVMLWLLFLVFLRVGIQFIARVVVLWLVIIAAPLAFVARTLDGTKEWYDTWQDYLIKFSIYPAVFLFLFLILTQFAGAITQGGSLIEGALNPLTTAGGAQETNFIYKLASAVANVAIRLGFIVVLLILALKISDKLGGMGASFGQTVTGWATSFVPRAGIFAGRAVGTGTLGLGGYALSQSKSLAGGGRVAQELWRGGRWLSQRSYDARAVPGVRTGFGMLGADVGTPGASWAATRKEDLKTYDKKQQEREAERKDLENQKAVSDYAKLKAVTTPTAAQKAETDRLQAKIQDFGKRELNAMGETNITKIAGALKENQKKIVEDSDSYSDSTKERVSHGWHEQSTDAPLKKANKIIEKLRNIETALRTTVPHELRRHTTAGATMTGDNIKLMTDEITSKMAETNRNLDVARRAGSDTTEFHQDLHNLREALNSLDKLNDERKKVPIKVGGRDNQGEFEVT